MKRNKQKPEKHEQFGFSLLGYPSYAIAKFFDTFRTLSFFLDKLETIATRNDINKLHVDRPIYITGLARSGTTITLEMLSKHPEVASHRYKHMLMPYLPHWFSRIAGNTNIFMKPVERVHRDGIIINRESPEAVEEMFWQKFFDDIHNENISNVLDGIVSNPKFERFYRNHVRKLMVNQRSRRYLTKNNYNVTRMEYLLRLFPTSKFLLLIRNPVNQIASLIKQARLFVKLEKKDPLLGDWWKILGHREFGYQRVCINVGNNELIQEIRKLWRNKKTYVKGWATYWSSIYNFVADRLEANQKLKKATLIVRYEDLCKTPARMIDNILEHSELSAKKFQKIKKYYINHLHEPTYYSPDFSQQDIAIIAEVTSSTAARFGY